MADPKPTPGTSPVTDHRPVPRGVLPQGAQTWLMAGLAVGIVLVIVIAGRPKPASPRATVTPVNPALNADSVRAYQERLRALETEAAQQEQAVANAPATNPAPLPGVPASTTSDPTAAERKKRAYDSLFASNVALSRRPTADRPDAGAGADVSRTGIAPGAPSAAASSGPSLDALADAVVRATTRAQQTTSPQATSRGPAPVSATTAGHSPDAAPSTAHTPPLRADASLHTILEGTLIDAVLTNRLDGSLPSPVNCLVTSPVYDFSGEHVVIPAGARLLGETRPVQSFGETRLAVAFHRLVLPDGSTDTLDQLPALNQAGDTGLRDQVNAHYWSTFGAAAAVGLISGLADAVGTVGVAGGSSDRTVVVAGNTASVTSQASAQVLDRFLNRLPTITIREGHRVEVYVTHDLHLPAFPSMALPQ
jgi:type IV secretion system protein VirB10